MTESMAPEGDLALGMPQMDAGGLSENWLFRHCGDRHWAHLCHALQVRSRDLRDGDGDRLYSTFIAIKARYRNSLSCARENEVFQTTVDLQHFGSPFFRSTTCLSNSENVFALEMLTSFVKRKAEGKNDLRKTLPDGIEHYNAPSLREPPKILQESKSVRRREKDVYRFCDVDLPLNSHEALCSAEYTPTPYMDFNGAGLLYFASYPTITDIGESEIISRQNLCPGNKHWALQASTSARDVFYYGNLNIGENLEIDLMHFEIAENTAITHSRIFNQRDETRQLPLAEVFTAKTLL